MARSSPQLATQLSAETLADLEAYVSSRGLKKQFVVEQALAYYLRALRELPADAFVPPTLVVSRRTAEWLLDQIEHPGEPTPAMKALFARKK